MMPYIFEYTVGYLLVLLVYCATAYPLGQSPTPPDSAFEDETSKSETAGATANVTASTAATTSTADTTAQQQQLRRISNVNDSSSSSGMQHTGYLILLYPVLLDCLVTRSRPVR
jgi:hypothetical protein